MELTSENVRKVFSECTTDSDDKKNDERYIEIKGIVNNFLFDKNMLMRHEDDIFSMLLDLPREFMRVGGGGGWSFLNACVDVNGRQWTGEHLLMETLFCMGIAIGKVTYLLPREVWGALPGGVPYLMVDNSNNSEEGETIND